MKYDLVLLTRRLAQSAKSVGLNRIPFIKPVYHFATGLITPEKVTMSYEEYRLRYRPGMPNLELELGETYEPAVTTAIKSYTSPGDTVLDVGGYLGYHTLSSRASVGSNGLVITFEPEPRNVELLKETVSLNQFENVVLEQKAVAGSTGTVELSVPDTGPSLPSTAKKFDEGNEVTVDSVALSDYLTANDLSAINFAKIDIEGAEYDLFCNDDGFTRIDTMVCEIHADLLDDGQIDEIFINLEQHGSVTDLAGGPVTERTGNFHILYQSSS